MRELILLATDEFPDIPNLDDDASGDDDAPGPIVAIPGQVIIVPPVDPAHVVPFGGQAAIPMGAHLVLPAGVQAVLPPGLQAIMPAHALAGPADALAGPNVGPFDPEAPVQVFQNGVQMFQGMMQADLSTSGSRSTATRPESDELLSSDGGLANPAVVPPGVAPGNAAQGGPASAAPF